MSGLPVSTSQPRHPLPVKKAFFNTGGSNALLGSIGAEIGARGHVKLVHRSIIELHNGDSIGNVRLHGQVRPSSAEKQLHPKMI